VIVDDTVFALVADASVGGELPPTSLVAFDADSGSQAWASEPLPGDVIRLAATELDGEPAIAALVVEQDEGDAVTEASQAWGYLAWPADVGEGDDAEPSAHVTAPATDPTAEVRWTDQGLLAGDLFLAPGADEFTPAQVLPEPLVVGDYDLDESFAGVSGELMLSYVRGLAYPSGGPENGESHIGWVARGLDGTQAWDGVEAIPNEGDTAVFAEGPTQLAMVVGGYALTITSTDESYTAFDTAWVDAATGEPAEPRPADIAGTVPVAAATDIIGGTAALASPDGTHLVASFSTLTVVLDVESGEVTPVDTDFEISLDAVDDTRAYGSTENGALTIDWSDGTATPLDPPQQGVTAVGDDHGAIIVGEEEVGGTPTLAVGRVAG
jgi:hypothetical protein